MTTAKVVKKQPRGQSRNCLHQASWAAFLDAHIHKGPNGDWILNKRKLSESDSRSYYRYKHEGAKPTIFSADHFLTRYWIHLDAYFLWCEAHDKPAWAFGEPDWHREEI